MPKLPFRLALLEQFVDGGRTILEPLQFPEIARLGGSSEVAQKSLLRNVELLLKHSDPSTLHARRAVEDLEVDSVTVSFSPPKHDLAWRREIQVTLPFVYWRVSSVEALTANLNGAQGKAETTIAYVPAFGMEVIAQGKQDIRRQVEYELRAAVARRRASSLEKLAPLAQFHELKIIRREIEADVMSAAKWSEYVERFGEESDSSALKEVASDLSKAPLPAAHEAEEQTERFARLLQAAKMPHVLLIGPSGVGKSALFYELVRRRREIGMAGREFWETSGARLVAGMSGFGMWQERTQRLLAETRKRDVILHLGNLVELMEVGKSVNNNQSIAAFLRNALYRGELTAVAECTEAQLDVIERSDPQLLAAFQPLRLGPPDSGRLQSILLAAAVEPPPKKKPRKQKRKKQRKEKEKPLVAMRAVSPDAIAAIERLHARFATYSAAPGRPLRFLRNLLQSGPSHEQIDELEVTRSFAKETGLPDFVLDDQQPMRISKAREWFSERIIGQEKAVNVIVNLLATIKAGLNRPTRPFASLMFVGPTGVGKTELAKALARFLYRDEQRLVRFDMSEFADPVAVDRLIGASFSSEGLLTKKVREQPFTVVLLDEIEKAYSSFFDLLLQVLGEGRLTDSSGRVADFRNSVIIMTSNLGAQAFRGTRMGLGDGLTQDRDAEAYFVRKVREFVRPELFNRIDRIVPFRPLAEEEIGWITQRELEKLKRRDGIRYRDVDLTLTPEAVAAIAAQGVDATLGARPLKRVIEQRVAAPMASKLNQHAAGHGYTIDVRSEDGRVAMSAKAKPQQADREGVGVLFAIDSLAQTRRRSQKLSRGGVSLRLQNEHFQLKQRHEQMLRQSRKWKKKGETEWVYFPEIQRLTKLAEVISKYRQLEDDVSAFEEKTMVDHYADRPLESSPIRSAVDGFEARLRAILTDIFQLDSTRSTEITLSVFSESKQRMLELIRAYEKFARTKEWQVMGRLVYRQYRPELDERSPKFDRSKCTRENRPNLRLTASLEVEADEPENGEEQKKPPKVLDVHRVQKFANVDGAVIGMAITLSGQSAFPLLEPERGLHEFVDKTGRNESCVVETSAGRVAKFSPPLDVCRRSFLTRAVRRRKYLLIDGVAEDALLKANLKIEGGSLKDAVEASINAYFSQALEKLLDE